MTRAPAKVCGHVECWPWDRGCRIGQRAPWVEDARPVAIPPQRAWSPMDAPTTPVTKPLRLADLAAMPRRPRDRRLVRLFVVLIGLTVVAWTPLVIAALGWWPW